MNVQDEVRIVRWSIIIMIASSSIGLTSDYLFAVYDNTTKLSIMSGFGEISIDEKRQKSLQDENNFYRDNDLEFQISKPDNSWEFHSATDYLLDRNPSLISKGYLDGMYIEKQHNKQFLLTVFDIKEENFQLKNHVERQIKQMEFQEIKIPIKQISESNDWAIFSIDLKKNGKFSYGEQILFFKENKLYMLQYTGKPPESLSENDKLDINFIQNTFRVI